MSSTGRVPGTVVPEKYRQVCSDVESTNRCLLKSIELPEAFWCRVSGTLGPGFLGAARCSLSRRAHVKAKGTLDSVEQKNYAVGEQKVGQPRRPTIKLVCTATTHIQQSNMDQPRKVAKPARGQLHKEVKYPCTVRRCIRGKYIHMYLHSTGLLFVFV